MNRKAFLTTVAALFTAPFLSKKKEKEKAIAAGAALIALSQHMKDHTVPAMREFGNHLKLQGVDLIKLTLTDKEKRFISHSNEL
jgi:hypothetical protein